MFYSPLRRYGKKNGGPQDEGTHVYTKAFFHPYICKSNICWFTEILPVHDGSRMLTFAYAFCQNRDYFFYEICLTHVV